MSAAADATVEHVTFVHPFTLPGLERTHAPGTFEVHVRREALDVSWAAYLISKTIMLTEHGVVEALEVKADDLEAALQRDAKS